MTIYKNISDGKLYTIYKNSDGELTAFPHGKVEDASTILKYCNLKDFVMHSVLKNNKIKGFI
jgi:hypothetical protein